MRALLAVLALAAVVLAGCASPYETPTSPATSTPPPASSGGSATSGSSTINTTTSPGPAGSQSNPASGSFTVKADDDNGTYFEPKEVWVHKGTKVAWTDTGSMPHTATADDGSWDTGNLAPGASGSHTFTATGDVPYACKYHKSAGMTGIVHVVS